MRFETERLILRDYKRIDREVYFRLKSDPKTMYYLPDIRLFTREEAEKDLAAILEDRKSEHRKFYFFCMETQGSQELVGSIGYTVVDDTPVGKLVDLGYFVFPQFWGRGYMTEALRKVLEFAFLENNVYRVRTGCLAENIGSEKVMQKCGLIKEAEHVDWEWHDDRMKTRVEYRMLRREWEQLADRGR